jgi:hypothetical protein
MNLRNTLLVSTVVIVAGTAASYWYLNRADEDEKKFKVGYLPVT